MPVKIEVKGIITTDVVGQRLPKASLLRELPEFAAVPEDAVQASMLKLQLPADENDPVRQKWLEWYGRPAARTWTARVVDPDGSTRWFDILPAKDPGEPFVWVFVAYATVEAFAPKLRIGSTMTLTCLGDACGAAVKRIEAANPAAPSADDTELMASSKALRKLIGHLEAGIPPAPEDAFAWFATDGAGPGRCGETCAAWERFLACPASPLAGEPSSRLLSAVRSVRTALASATLRPERPLDQLHRLVEQLEGVATKFRAEWRQRQRETTNAVYNAPNYEITADHLLGEFQAFAIAARRAAMHETVFGSLIESRVLELVARATQPLSVSSGALAGVSYPQQIDGLIWNHQFAPPVIQHGSVAVVPAYTVAGVFEVKAGANLGEFALRMEYLRDDLALLRAGSAVETIGVPLLGLVIVDDQSYEQVRSGSRNNITSLFRRIGLYDYAPNRPGIIDLLSFLYDQVLPVSRAMAAQASGRERIQSG